MEPVLVMLYLDKELRLKADTSDYTTGRVLLIKQGQWFLSQNC